MQHENSIFAICNPTMLQTIEKVGLRYIDRALSAKTDNRPDFQQMIKDSEKRLFDIVLVWSLTVLPETAMIRPTMSTSWNEIMSSWYLPRSLSLTALRVSWSRVC